MRKVLDAGERFHLQGRRIPRRRRAAFRFREPAFSACALPITSPCTPAAAYRKACSASVATGCGSYVVAAGSRRLSCVTAATSSGVSTPLPSPSTLSATRARKLRSGNAASLTNVKDRNVGNTARVTEEPAGQRPRQVPPRCRPRSMRSCGNVTSSSMSLNEQAEKTPTRGAAASRVAGRRCRMWRHRVARHRRAAVRAKPPGAL